MLRPTPIFVFLQIHHLASIKNCIKPKFPPSAAFSSYVMYGEDCSYNGAEKVIKTDGGNSGSGNPDGGNSGSGKPGGGKTGSGGTDIGICRCRRYDRNKIYNYIINKIIYYPGKKD